MNSDRVSAKKQGFLKKSLQFSFPSFVFFNLLLAEKSYWMHPGRMTLLLTPSGENLFLTKKNLPSTRFACVLTLCIHE